jgi:hypothetical protein
MSKRILKRKLNRHLKRELKRPRTRELLDTRRKSLYYLWLRTIRVALRFVKRVMILSSPLSINRTAGVFTALLVIALAAPSARAACGDYLHVAGEKSASRSESPTPAPLPCHCPQCSQAPCQMPEAPPVTNPTLGEEPALVSVLESSIDNDQTRFARATSDRLPADVGLSCIFHPPR